jgi:hypothetical protein
MKRNLLTLINHVLSVKSSSEGVFRQDSFLEALETPRQCLGKPPSSSHDGKEEHARDWEKLMAKATTALDGVAQLSEERERELQDTQLQLRLVSARPATHPRTNRHLTREAHLLEAPCGLWVAGVGAAPGGLARWWPCSVRHGQQRVEAGGILSCAS